jgi:hypothetical protein
MNDANGADVHHVSKSRPGVGLLAFAGFAAQLVRGLAYLS